MEGTPVREEHLHYLVCPTCKSDLALSDARKGSRSAIESGMLRCLACQSSYPIIADIPRFVPRENYASGFGLEWTKHAKTQHDSYSGINISETRFFDETKWPRRLEGQLILEVGSGSGRFTVHAASTGATVVSMDYSYAVEANLQSNGQLPNVLIVQGDIYCMPFRYNFFDKLFCFGVLQHTPRVRKSFMSLPPYLKSGGSLVIDVYRKESLLKTLVCSRHYARMLTTRLPPEKLYPIVKWYVEFMWPMVKLLAPIPVIGKRLIGRLLINEYRGIFDLSEEMHKEWAILDTFDMLSPKYTNRQTLQTVRQWLLDAGMVNSEVQYGYNGIEGRGTKP
jgi:uncharacterized protein YbaR (Trm112 family)